jgi:catechol 2,3-dioxygenase-like lactoylglutathione lyase family enzyme
MPSHLGAVTYLVRDYDEAIAWFKRCLRFSLVEDTVLVAATADAPAKRWVLVAPPGAPQTRLLLARASTPSQLKTVGVQAGGRVMFFLCTDDFVREHAALLAAGVVFREAPRREAYGMVAVFEDLYGQPWDLLELKRSDGALKK